MFEGGSSFFHLCDVNAEVFVFGSFVRWERIVASRGISFGGCLASVPACSSPTESPKQIKRCCGKCWLNAKKKNNAGLSHVFLRWKYQLASTLFPSFCNQGILKVAAAGGKGVVDVLTYCCLARIFLRWWLYCYSVLVLALEYGRCLWSGVEGQVWRAAPSLFSRRKSNERNGSIECPSMGIGREGGGGGCSASFSWENCVTASRAHTCHSN